MGRDARGAHPVADLYHEPDRAGIESLRVGSFEDYRGVSDPCLDHHGIGIRWRSERESRVSGRADGEEPRLSPKHRWPGSWEGVELVHQAAPRSSSRSLSIEARACSRVCSESSCADSFCTDRARKRIPMSRLSNAMRRS